MSWKKVPIKSVCTGIYDGPHATPPVSNSGAIFLGISNFVNGRLDLSDIRFISEEDLPKWTKRVTPQYKDIVFSYEATLNLYAIIPEGFRGCLGRRMALLRINDEIADYKFIYYYMFSDRWRSVIQENTVLGATVDRIPLIKFPDFEIELPPRKIQTKIAQIISAYDDLIENNQKQIKLLEEAAQRLYKEWFVDLRFPGYEDVKIVDGVPEGWRVLKLEDVISYQIGGGWGEETNTGNNDQEAYVIRGTDLNGLRHGEFLDIPLRFHLPSNLNARTLQHGDIVFEVSGGSRTEGVARTARIINLMLQRWNKPVMCASFCKLVRPLNPEISQYLFDHFRYLREEKITEEFDKRSASSIVNYRWKDFLTQRAVLYPSEDCLGKYNSIAEPLYEKIMNCSLQIESAKQNRDRLLPKLMSGEIEL